MKFLPKIDQTNDKPNKYKRWIGIHDVDYNADVEREQEQFGVGVGVVVQEKREQGQLGAGTHFIAFGSGRDLVDPDLVEKLRTSNRYLEVKEKMRNHLQRKHFLELSNVQPYTDEQGQKN